jgi:hypothetical protein
MRSKRGPVGLLVLTAAFLVLAVGAVARADTGDVIEPQHEPPTSKDGWQAGTCYENQVEEDPTKTDLTKPFCSPETPGLFFTQAGGHPPFGFDQYIVRHETVVPGVIEPLIEDPSDPLPFEDRVLKTERVDLPPGFTENPQSSPKCSQEDFENIVIIEGQPRRIPACDPSTIVGREEVWLVVNTANAVPGPAPGTFLPKGFVIPPEAAKGTRVPVYNLEPNAGEPARLGFVVAFSRLIELHGAVAWESDFHEYFTIHLPEPSVGFSTLKSRLLGFGQSGDGTHLTTPTTCFNPIELPHLYSTWFRGESWGEPNPTFPEGSTPWEAKLPPGVMPTGCEKVPFDPSIEADAGTPSIDSPAPATVTAKLPFLPAKEGGEVRVNEGVTEGISQSHVRRAEISLPEGMGLNPSGANGLVACTDAQFKKGQRVETNECPAASVIGTVEVVSPPLAEPLEGDVYVGEQKSQDPQSGEMFRILIEAKSTHEGIVARLVGNVKANPATGELTAVLTDKIVGQFAGALPDGLPQVPFESVKMHLDGSKATLTSPPTCATFEATGQFEPWARPGEQVPVSAKLPPLSSDPGGGSCPRTLAERKFSPGFSASMKDRKAGAYSPFALHIGRSDGQQEIRRVDVDLPPGMVAKLKGVEYCPEANIAAAATQSGTAVLAKPACPDKSFVGTSGIDAGSGPNPFHTNGNVYLAGPYKGAPLSMVFITSAVAGPFDLGNVVVRVALNIDPETAEVHAVSDPIPFVFGGAKLDIRNIDVSISRKKFTLNPTTCRQAFPIGAGIFGGGGDPANPASWSESKPSNNFRATNCKALKFKPQFFARILGGENQTKRTKNPKFRATYDARKGDANLRRAAFILPRATILDQSHIKTICTRVQLAAEECPKNAIYGHAKATSPLLAGKLKGPVYLTSSSHELPDLLVDLKGQVDIRLRGVISSRGGRLKTVFNNTPDVAVNKFVLTMKGGDRGLLVNSRDLCERQTAGVLNLKAQNSRRLKSKNLRLNIPACRGD